MKFFLSFYPLAFVFLANEVFGEIFTSLVDMEKLFIAEDFVVDSIKRFMVVTEEKLTKLKRFLEEFESQHNQAQQGIQKYVENPINAYLMTKRLTVDWAEIEGLMRDDIGPRIVNYVKKLQSENRILLPTDEDLSGAAVAITRLQGTYEQSTASLARGEVNGVQYDSRLSASDCLELGVQTFKNFEYHYAYEWVNEAMHRYHEEVNKTVELDIVLHFLAHIAYNLQDPKQALLINSKVLEMNPNDTKALSKQKLYKNKLKRSSSNESSEIYDFKEAISLMKGTEEEVLPYRQLCRKQVTVSERVRSTLKCRYVDFGRAFLKLARLKEEEAYLDPRIVMYHDVLYDNEIKVIKELATPRFFRATVHSTNNTQVTVSYRISKVAWLGNEMDPIIKGLSRRIEDITGLETETAEALQVVNYGIGGHYEPHVDFTRMTRSDIYRGTGNRLATILFYMDDVKQGGATVFPELNVALWPRKGSAALWYNLFKNGVGDNRTRHASCPVLLGSKWICNKWLHERGQEFRKPCGLTENEAFFFERLGIPVSYSRLTPVPYLQSLADRLENKKKKKEQEGKSCCFLLFLVH